jgi:hypothetical protein
MAKSVNLEPESLYDLISNIIKYCDDNALREYFLVEADQADRIPESGTVEHYKFEIKNPTDRVFAVMALLVGWRTDEKRSGNPSFNELDEDLMLELLRESRKNNIPEIDLLDKYIPRAYKRSKNTEDETIRRRLINVLRKIKKSPNFENLFTESLYWDMPSHDEFFIRGAISPWLKKNKNLILKILSDTA